MILYLCFAAIIIAIILGWKFDFNIGILAMGFAFVISIFFMDGSVKTVVGYWPVSIVFFLLSISLFFTYATSNGTMSLLGRYLLYAMNGNAKLIPWVISLVSSLIAFLGAGASTPAIVAPLALSIGLEAGIQPIVIAVAIGCSVLIGADNPINGFGGVISKNLIADNGYTNAFGISMNIWINSIITQLIVIGITYIVFKGYKAKRVEITKPEAFNDVQKKTLMLIILAFVSMMLPMIINAWIGKSPIISKIVAITQPQSVMIIAAILAMALKLGDEKEIIRKLPMNLIIMIAGVAMLLEIAKEAGLIEAMSEILSNNFSGFWIPSILVLLAAFLSYFSSGTSVVCPLMYPLVPGISESLGISPVILFSCIYIGAMSSALSPFSTGGSLIIAGYPDPNTKDELAKWMIPASIIIPFICAIIATFGIYNIFAI